MILKFLYKLFYENRVFWPGPCFGLVAWPGLGPGHGRAGAIVGQKLGLEPNKIWIIKIHKDNFL